MMRDMLPLRAEYLWQYFQKVSNEIAFIYFFVYSDCNCSYSFAAVVLEVNSVRGCE